MRSPHVLADSSVKLQARCRALARAADVYRLPFSGDSLGIIATNSGDGDSTWQGGRYFNPMNVLKFPRENHQCLVPGPSVVVLLAAVFHIT